MILVAVETCHKYRNRADAQRETWAKNIPAGIDLRFFLGRGEAQRPDEVILDVDDGYNSLPEKTRAICRWAKGHGYPELFKTDDDCYTQLDRLAEAVPLCEYRGRVRGPSGIFPAPYCSGLGYWLGPKAMDAVIAAEPNGDTAEDRWVGNSLLKAGIRPMHDGRYAVISSQQNRNARSASEGPREGNSLITVCEFIPEVMKEVHQQYLEIPSGMRTPPLKTGKLSRVCVLVKTFLRDGYLFRCIQGIESNLPEAKIVIVDDGQEAKYKITRYAELREAGHVCEWLPYDSGFGAKGNAGVQHCDREFVLIASDDFDFGKGYVRGGIERLVTVLDADPSIHIVSGRVNGNCYESCLEETGTTVREIPKAREKRHINGIDYFICDLTVNYSLIRRECFGPDRLHWDGGEVKIGGGEHGAFFLDAKRLGYGVAVVPDAIIHEFENNPTMIHPMYPQARARARMPGRQCLRSRGVEKWILQDGSAEAC